MSLLEQDITRKEQVNNAALEFETGNNKEYKVVAIIDSTVYGKDAKNHILGFY